MKNNSRMPDQRARRRLPRFKGAPGMLALCVFSGWMLMSPAAMAGNSAKFTAKLLQGTCTITFLNGDTSTSPAITGKLQLPPTDSATLSNCQGSSGAASTQCIGPTTPVTVKLTGCGLGDAAKTPTVTLNGINAVQTDVADANQYMFRDPGVAGGTSRGYFLVVGTNKNPVWGGTDLIKTTQAVIDKTHGSGGGAGSSGNGAWNTIYLGASCGTQDCNLATTKAGSLNASLQFDFAYK